jgi:hypothetical protein
MDAGYEEWYRVGGIVAKALTRGEYLGWKPGLEKPTDYDFTNDEIINYSDEELNMIGYAWETHHGFTGWSTKEEFEKTHKPVVQKQTGE